MSPADAALNHDFTFRAIREMALLEADTIELDISDTCVSLFVFICMSNMSAMLMFSAVLGSWLNFVCTAAVSSAMESVKDLLEIEPELLTRVVGVEPTFELGPRVDVVESFVLGADAVSDALGVLADVEPLADALLPESASGAA